MFPTINNKQRQYSQQEGSQSSGSRVSSLAKAPPSMITPPNRNLGKRSITNSNGSRNFSSPSSISRLASKQDLLSRFQDQEEDGIFTTPQTLRKEYNQSNENFLDFNDFNDEEIDPYLLDNDFQTLRISSSDLKKAGNQHNTIETLKQNASKTRRSLSPHQDLNKYVESPENIDSFDEDFLDLNEISLDRTKKNKFPPKPPAPPPIPPALSPHTARLSPSPTTLSTASPKRRKSLSEYSEDTNDTDITSQLDGDDFEDVDNIFGEGESGIYNNISVNGSSAANNTIKARNHFLTRQRKLQKDAEAEERELYNKYKKLHEHNEANTLRLKDFNESSLIEENEDNQPDNFEDDFDLESPIKFDKLKQFRSRKPDNSLNAKISMPNLKKMGSNINLIKKYKSTINFVNDLEQEHPVFNNNNKIIRKLDRMPSFYNKNNQNSSDDKLHQDIELQKQQLLEKFMEISEKQKKLQGKQQQQEQQQHQQQQQRHRSRYAKPSKQSSQPGKKRIGLVKYCTNGVPETITQNSKMKYNAENSRWEGNDIDLLRFGNLNSTSSNSRSTNHLQLNNQLITNDEFDHSKKIHGNMIFDAENLRWINLDGDKSNDDVFETIENLTNHDQSDINQRKLSRKSTKRGASQSTQRTSSTSSLVSEGIDHGYQVPNEEINEDVEEETNEEEEEEVFNIPESSIDRFLKEEQRILRKTRNWFHYNATYATDGAIGYNHDYLWEIRKMVVDDESD